MPVSFGPGRTRSLPGTYISNPNKSTQNISNWCYFIKYCLFTVEIDTLDLFTTCLKKELASSYLKKHVTFSNYSTTVCNSMASACWCTWRLKMFSELFLSENPCLFLQSVFSPSCRASLSARLWVFQTKTSSRHNYKSWWITSIVNFMLDEQASWMHRSLWSWSPFLQLDCWSRNTVLAFSLIKRFFPFHLSLQLLI